MTNRFPKTTYALSDGFLLARSNSLHADMVLDLFTYFCVTSSESGINFDKIWHMDGGSQKEWLCKIFHKIAQVVATCSTEYLHFRSGIPRITWSLP